MNSAMFRCIGIKAMILLLLLPLPMTTNGFMDGISMRVSL